jgi:hypothetical protein
MAAMRPKENPAPRVDGVAVMIDLPVDLSLAAAR